MKKSFAAIVLVLATATACNGGSPTATPTSTGTPTPTFTADELTAIDSLTTSFSTGKHALVSDAGAANCIATALVGQLGTDTLQSYKLLNATMGAKKGLGVVPMSDADASVAADAVLGCIDPIDAVNKVAANAGLKKKQANCLAKKLSPDALKIMFVSYLTQSPSLDPSVLKPLRQCT